MKLVLVNLCPELHVLLVYDIRDGGASFLSQAGIPGTLKSSRTMVLERLRRTRAMSNAYPESQELPRRM